VSVKPSYTPADLCDRWRCSHSHVLNLIRAGELVAINIGTGGRSRYVVSAESLDDFESGRTVRPPAKQSQRRRKKRADVIEFFS
jgi:hypothetical protein